MRYLEGKFGDPLDAARDAMMKLARSQSPADIAEHAYVLYEQFRPEIPAGVRSWGAEGVVDLDLITRLANIDEPA